MLAVAALFPIAFRGHNSTGLATILVAQPPPPPPPPEESPVPLGGIKNIIQHVQNGTQVGVGYNDLEPGPHELTMTLQAFGAATAIDSSQVYDPNGTVIWTSDDNTTSAFEHHWTANGFYAEEIVAPTITGTTNDGTPGTFSVDVSHVNVEYSGGNTCGGGGAPPLYVDETESTAGIRSQVTYSGPDLPATFPIEDQTGGPLTVSIHSQIGGTVYFDGLGNQAAVYRTGAGGWEKVTVGITVPPGGLTETFRVHTSNQFTGPVMLRTRIQHATTVLDAADLVRIVYDPPNGCNDLVDLDIDSDNTNGFEPPDRNGIEDAIEDIAGDPTKPGKIVALNNGDQDADGIPDFADGYNRDGVAGNADDTPPSEAKFVPLVLQLSDGVDLSNATLTLTYNGSDPLGVTASGTPVVYAPAAGYLRIWTKDASSPRSGNSFAATPTPGDYVPPGSFGPSQLAGLGFTATNRTVTLYVEGIRASLTPADQRILAQVDPDGGGPAPVVEDAVRVTVDDTPADIDLDIDSDNNNGFGPPDRTAEEDAIEDIAGDPDKPGKFLVLNDRDGDNDGIPEFADGFNLDGITPNADDTPPTDAQFVPLVLELKSGVDLSTATLTFTYSASDPAGVTTTGMAPDLFYTPASGHLRIWTKNASVARKKNSFAAASAAGDYVPAGVAFGPADLGKLGFTATSRTVTLYVEAVRKKPAIAELQITAEVDPDGAGPKTTVKDAVRVTILGVDIDADTDRDETIEDDDDEKGEDKWVKTRGAIFAVNLDRDGSRTSPTSGLSIGDAIHYGSYLNGAGYPTYENFVIENEIDEKDITPFVIRQILPKIPAGYEVWLKLGSLQQAQRVHIFKKIKADPANTAILGRATGTGAPPIVKNITHWVNPSDPVNFQGDATTKDTTMGIEGMFFRFVGSSVPANLYFEGIIDLTLELRKGGAVVHSDTVKLKVAPWMMLSRDQASQQIWAGDFTAYATNVGTYYGLGGPYYGIENSEFLSKLATSGQLNKVVGPTPATFPTVPGNWAEVASKWFQDHLEIGYTQRPGGPKSHIVFRLPYDHKTDWQQPTWPLTKLLAKDIGVFQIGQKIGATRASGDFGGNLEVLSPSATFPLGLMATGDIASPLLKAFLASQEVQNAIAPLFDVPVSWLLVGHIDEVTSFLAGHKVAIADPTMAWNLISDTTKIPEADRHRAVFFGIGPQPEGGDVGAAIANRLYDGPAIGEIKTIAEGMLADGDKLVIMASATVSKTFEVDIVGGVAAGNIAIDLTGAGASTAKEVRDKIIAAVNGAGFDVKAIANVAKGDDIVHLWNQVKGTGGNQTIEKLPAGNAFTVTGMSGGKAGGRDFSVASLAGWKYIRTYKFTPAAGGVPAKAENGQVGVIGGLHDGWVDITRVANTGSKIIAGGMATNYLEKYASKAAICPQALQWFSMPVAGDKYVVVKDSRLWETQWASPPAPANPYPVYCPAIVTVAELLADADFEALNKTDVQEVVDTYPFSVRNMISVRYPSGPPTFIKVPSLFFGKRIMGGGIVDGSAHAFNPGPTNLQPVNGKLYVPIQAGPMATAGADAGKDILAESIKSALGPLTGGAANVEFVENWYVYHDWFGEVHCGSVVKRQVLSVNWWENQP